MNLEITLSEISQTEKDKYHMISLTVESKKLLIQMNLFTKQKQTHRHRKQTYGYQSGKRGEGYIWNFRLTDTDYYMSNR